MSCNSFLHSGVLPQRQRFVQEDSISRSILNPDRRPDKSKCIPNLIFKKPLIGEMQLHRAISEEDEGGRRNPSLGHIVNSHSLTYRNRGAFEVNFFQEAVHLASGDPLAALSRNRF